MAKNSRNAIGNNMQMLAHYRASSHYGDYKSHSRLYVKNPWVMYSN